jgi:hypothetical protein
MVLTKHGSPRAANADRQHQERLNITRDDNDEAIRRRRWLEIRHRNEGLRQLVKRKVARVIGYRRPTNERRVRRTEQATRTVKGRPSLQGLSARGQLPTTTTCGRSVM